MAKIEFKDTHFYMDGFLKRNLDFAIEAIKKDDDWLLIVDGRERSGKSVLAQQVGWYVYNNLNIDFITFSVKDWEQKINDAPKYSCVIWDEAFEGLSKRSYISKINKKIVNILMKCGQKNLFLILVMPTFFELDKYVVLHRSKGLLHVHRDKAYKRGYYKFYNASTMKKMYIDGCKYYNYNKKCDFPGWFSNFYTVDEAEYRLKKEKDLEKKGEEEQEDNVSSAVKQRNLILYLFNKLYFNNATRMHKEITTHCPTFDLSLRQTQEILKKTQNAECVL